MSLASKKKTDVAADLVADAIKEAPKSNDEVVATLQAEKQQPANAPTPANAGGSTPPPVRDSKGVLFDPAKHGAKRDGTPSFNADGTFRGRRGSLKINTTPGPIAPDDTTNIVASKKFAEWSAAMFFNTTVQIFGPHWEPQPDERKRINEDTERAYVAWGIIDLPPGLCLCMSIAMYALPRAADPRTRERVASMLASLKGKKTAPAPVNDATGSIPGE